MRCFAVLMIPIVAAVSGCVGPIETRIQTQAGPALPTKKIYSFTARPEQNSPAYQTARKIVAGVLESKNFVATEDAPIRVHIALANRPASIAMTTGENDKLNVIAEKKKRKLLQSCDDREHRLTITMVNILDGSAYYSGTAAEYHCKGSLEQSLPHLVDAALSDLGKIDKPMNIKTRTRSGIE
ncbi:hypothetical protein AB1K62_06545 [Parasphingorhabdus sp. JC815]|uniref:hypothetical protein n=1 Tax=Parasphingorhabdus sp. JC815 TaxID=3232140 RepID=UPI003458F74D